MVTDRRLGLAWQKYQTAHRERRVIATSRQLAGSKAMRLVKPVVHRYGNPTMRDLTSSGAHLNLSAPDLLQGLFPDQTAASVEQLSREWTELAAELGLRKSASGLSAEYPDNYALAPQAALTLYSIIRTSKPDCVIETGVANGSSSFYILHALAQNGNGTLHSIDLRDNVGMLLTTQERQEWDLILLDRARLRKSFTSIMSQYTIDLFLHDSDHSFAWQSLEYCVALERMRPDGFLLSDDVDSSHAFRAFCASLGVTPHLLLDEDKVFGILSS